MSQEFEVGGHKYRAEKLDVFEQFRVSRRLAPLLLALMSTGKIGKGGLNVGAVSEMKDEDMFAVCQALVQGLATLKDEDVDYVLNACLDKTVREQTGGGWCSMRESGKLRFEDLDMVSLLTITAKVLQHNLSGFFATLPQGSPGMSRT